nr:bifunctional metallophosphatase/5'-nucleotidase [Rubrobacter marinus]
MVESYRWHVAAVVGLALVLPPSLIPAAAEPGGGRHEIPDTGPARAQASERDTVDLRILGVNDLHGNLEPLREGDRAVGGVAYLDAHLDGQERAYPGRAIRVHAGDMVGASPLVSGRYRDEPTVRAMNEMGFDVGTLGNHEFDEGGEEMLRLLNGGGGEGGGPADGRFLGADFPYVSANVQYRGSGETVLPPYAVVERDGVRVGFIGATTEDTPLGLMPEAAEPFRFTGIAGAVNRQATALEAEGVEAIIVLAHAGGTPGGAGEAPRGEIFEETARMSDEVDAVISGHTHNIIDARVGGKVVVQAGEYGEAFSVVDLRIDRRSGEVVRAEGEVLPTLSDAVRPDRALNALVERYGESVAPVSDRTVANAAGGVSRRATPAGESAMGDLVADGQRAYAGADLAFVNTPGLREDLPSGPTTYGELFAVHPFGDDLVRIEMTGDAVLRVLEQQHAGGRRRILG